MEKTILVIGATGTLGESVARSLKEDGFRVRIMARDRDKTRKMFNEFFEIVVGDVTDTNSLEESLEGCFGVHINLNPPETEQLGAENVASIASKKGIGRITYISGTNAFDENSWFPTTKYKLEAEKAIRESGVPYTFFCPTCSMESLSQFIKGGRAAVFGKQPNPYHWFATDDLARMVSSSYGIEEAANKKFFIHGPEPILAHEAVMRYCTVFHPEIKKITTIPYWLASIMATITRNEKMKFGYQLLAFFEKIGEGGDPTEANRILGSPKITLDEWLEKRKNKLDKTTVG